MWIWAPTNLTGRFIIHQIGGRCLTPYRVYGGCNDIATAIQEMSLQPSLHLGREKKSKHLWANLYKQAFLQGHLEDRSVPHSEGSINSFVCHHFSRGRFHRTSLGHDAMFTAMFPVLEWSWTKNDLPKCESTKMSYHLLSILFCMRLSCNSSAKNIMNLTSKYPDILTCC